MFPLKKLGFGVGTISCYFLKIGVGGSDVRKEVSAVKKGSMGGVKD